VRQHKPIKKWQRTGPLWLGLFLFAAFSNWGQTTRRLPPIPVVMISIDGSLHETIGMTPRLSCHRGPEAR
jgi:hypothetical protein